MDQKTLNQIEKIINQSLTFQEKRLEEKFATKDDLKSLATKDDLNNLATKSDLDDLRTEIANDVRNMVHGFGNTLDEKFAKKELVAPLEARILELERKVAP